MPRSDFEVGKMLTDFVSYYINHVLYHELHFAIHFKYFMSNNNFYQAHKFHFIMNCLYYTYKFIIYLENSLEKIFSEEMYKQLDIFKRILTRKLIMCN